MCDDGDDALTDYEADAARAAHEANGASDGASDGASSAEPPGRRERNRYKGDATTVETVLAPLVTSRSLVQYDESPLVSKAKLDPRRITKLHAVLQAFEDVDHKPSFAENHGVGDERVGGHEIWVRAQARAPS